MPYFLYAKRPRGANQLAEMIVDISTGEIEDAISKNKKDQDTQGRAGGLKGGKARAETLKPEKCSDIVRTAALARWNKSES